MLIDRIGPKAQANENMRIEADCLGVIFELLQTLINNTVKHVCFRQIRNSRSNLGLALDGNDINAKFTIRCGEQQLRNGDYPDLLQKRKRIQRNGRVYLHYLGNGNSRYNLGWLRNMKYPQTQQIIRPDLVSLWCYVEAVHDVNSAKSSPDRRKRLNDTPHRPNRTPISTPRDK